MCKLTIWPLKFVGVFTLYVRGRQLSENLYVSDVKGVLSFVDIYTCYDTIYTYENDVPKNRPFSLVSLATNYQSTSSTELAKLWTGGNWRLEYLDKGQVSRRIVEFEFTRHLTNEDPTLKRRILSDELAPLMLKCLLQYKATVEMHSDHGVWQFCPDYFRDQQEEMRMERNPLYGFLSTCERVLYEKGAETGLQEVKEAFTQYLGKGVKKLDHGTFRQVNGEWTVQVKKICKSCKAVSRKGCCDQYGQGNRTSSEVVRNFRLK